MGFIKTVLIIIVAFYLIGFIGKYLFPFLIKRQVKKMQDRYNSQYQQEQKQEGEVTVENARNKKNLLDTNEAEDVDFEEVE
jgi:hypothetical protein